MNKKIDDFENRDYLYPLLYWKQLKCRRDLRMIIIGEKINGSIPAVADAIARRDGEFIKERARMQDEAGATYIDLSLIHI